MLTFFTTAKPFRGHDGIIQRNALKSWKMLHPDVEVILFGDEPGAAEIASELGLRHEPHVSRNEFGKKRLDTMFARAQSVARHDYVCYCNCDIILLNDFLQAFQKARAWREHFLLVGQRRDVDVTGLIDFKHPNWSHSLRRRALAEGIKKDEYWIDFFLFTKGVYVDMPRLIVGYCFWDNWMIWKALSQSVPVLDSSAFILTIHENHEYSAVSGRIRNVAEDPTSLLNLQLIGGRKHIRHIKSATHRMAVNGRIYPNFVRYTHDRKRLILMFVQKERERLLYKAWLPTWHFLLGITRPMRHLLGLRSKAARSRQKI
jgi:hypothetical protein